MSEKRPRTGSLDPEIVASDPDDDSSDGEQSGSPEAVSLLLQQTRFQGPIPPPEAFAGYDEVLPGSAERIMAMAERVEAHRMRMEERGADRQDATLKAVQTGQTYGLVIALAALVLGTVGAVVAFVLEQPIVGGAVFAFGGVAPVIRAFMSVRRGSSSRNDEPHSDG